MSEPWDLLVIGGGSGGVRAARFAAQTGARVALIEQHDLGGTCVNVGCVPKKLMVYGAQFAEAWSDASAYGWQVPTPTFSWPVLRDHVRQEVQRLSGLYGTMLTNSEVTVYYGHARFLDAQRVQVGETVLSARHVLIATGGWPDRPDIPGIERAIDSNDFFSLPELPARTVVLGGGYIALELAGILQALGSAVTVVHRNDQWLRGFDDDVRQHVLAAIQANGVTLVSGATVTALAEDTPGTTRVHAADGSTWVAECVLVATGRRPRSDALGLEHTAVTCDARGFIQVNAQFQTADPAISAIGDVIGPRLSDGRSRLLLTPVALAEGMAVARRLFGHDPLATVDYEATPTAVFTDPPLATVGLTEAEARARGHRVRVFESRFRPMKKTLTASTGRVYAKLIVDAETDRVLGCHWVGPEAGEIIQGFAVAIRCGATKAQFDATMGIHPTAAEELVTMRMPRSD